MELERTMFVMFREANIYDLVIVFLSVLSVCLSVLSVFVCLSYPSVCPACLYLHVLSINPVHPVPSVVILDPQLMLFLIQSVHDYNTRETTLLVAGSMFTRLHSLTAETCADKVHLCIH